MYSNMAMQLQEIGYQLDNNILPEVINGGIVLPSKYSPLHQTLGKENDYDAKRRPEARSWKRPTRRQGSTGGRRSAGQATPFISTNLRDKYEEQIEEIMLAYPDTQVTRRNDGLWLISKSELLHNFERKAIFLTSIPYCLGFMPRSWGYWDSSQWIGPRHTNYPDGSICAFEQSDGTWLPGESLVELLDIYTLWAVRHLHLFTLGRWPGQQRIHTAYERISELKDDEFCGCDVPKGLYKNCCKKGDILTNQVADLVAYGMCQGGGRKPPVYIEGFMHKDIELPNICKVYGYD